MQRFKYSILAAAGILVLSSVLIAIGPKRVMAALGYTPVRDVDRRQPYQAGAFAFPPAGTFGGSVTLPAVPAGKRLVIEYVSISGTVNIGQNVLEGRLDFGGAGGDFHAVSMPFQGQSPIRNYYVGSERVQMFVDAGNPPTLHVERSHNTDPWTIHASVAGYLVDVP